MAISLYMDVHIPQAITQQLRRRSINVLTAFDDESQELPYDRLLERKTEPEEWMNTVEHLPFK